VIASEETETAAKMPRAVMMAIAVGEGVKMVGQRAETGERRVILVNRIADLYCVMVNSLRATPFLTTWGGSRKSSAIGVYLGRLQRWNSWDIVTRPDDLLASVLQNLLHPASHPRSLGMTVIFGGCADELRTRHRLRWGICHGHAG
jgi:hypothetical protein